MVPFAVDLKADCGKPPEQRCGSCCACHGKVLPEEGPFTEAVLQWIVDFMLSRYTVRFALSDILVSSSCKSSKLSLHVSIPYRLANGPDRIQFKAQLKDARAGADAIAAMGSAGWLSHLNVIAIQTHDSCDNGA